MTEIKNIHEESRKRYGSPRIHAELKRQGYSCSLYRVKRLMRQSFTGTGACLNNAHIESFFATLKKELVYQTEFKTREQASLAITEFINMFYNSWRLHSSLGYLCPNDFEIRGLERLAA